MRLRGARATAIAPGLPIPYPALVRAGVRFRPGQVSLTVAAPGVGKSQLWNNLAQRMPSVGVLYWSADTDQADITCRSLAMWSGHTVNQVEENLTSWRDYLFDKLGDNADHVEWVFEPRIDAKGVNERIDSYAEVHGEYPNLVVLDNLSNTIAGTDQQEHIEIRNILGGVQRLARRTGAHIAVLHHAKGEYEGGDRPIPQNGALQNPFKIPEVGLTLFHPGGDQGRLGVCVVKNRSGGASDPAAQWRNATILQVDYSRATVLGFETREEGTDA